MNIIKITREQLEKALGGVVKVLIRDNDYDVLLDIPAMVELQVTKAVNDVVDGALLAGEQIIEQLELPLKTKQPIQVNGQLEIVF